MANEIKEETKGEKTPYSKALFYVGNPYLFRSTLIGHLYEVAQVHPVVLLSEKLDSETQTILQDKKLFPKLEKIIPVDYFSKTKTNLFSKNKYLCGLAKSVIRKYRPDIVIAPTDYSFFELYLMRFAKKAGVLKIAVQTSNSVESITMAKLVDLINANLRFPCFLPFWLRFFLVKCRKYFGHFFYYWILPLTALEKPFWGKSSFILRKGNSGMRDADYQIVFSKRDYDIFLKEGVPAEKLKILPHPLARETKNFFEKAYFNKFKNYKKDKKVVCVMVPEDTVLGFDKKNYSLIISKKERIRNHIEIIKTINKILSDWEIDVKIHPDTKNFEGLKGHLIEISENIEIIAPREPIDKYIELSDVIIGLSLSASTALFTASLQCPEKPIISLDFHQELLGDYYKNFDGIEYIDNKEKFIKILELIQDNKYQKELKKDKEEIMTERKFSNTVGMLEYLFNKKENNSL